MAESDKVFAGSIPKSYDTLMVPLNSEAYAADLAQLVAACAPWRRPGGRLDPGACDRCGEMTASGRKAVRAGPAVAMPLRIRGAAVERLRPQAPPAPKSLRSSRRDTA